MQIQIGWETLAEGPLCGGEGCCSSQPPQSPLLPSSPPVQITASPHHPACMILLISIKNVTALCCCHPGTGATLQNVFTMGGSWRGNQALVAPPPPTEPPTPVASAACRVRAKLLSASSHFTCPVSLGGSTATILVLPITKLGSEKVTRLETRSMWL